MSYEVGQVVTVTFTVRDSAGVLTDAATAIDVTDPAGTVTHPTITHTGLGTYTAPIPATAPGVWLYVFTASGTVSLVQSNQFSVRRPGPQIVSLIEAKAHLNKMLSVTVDDDEIRGFIDAAQLLIEDLVGPVVPATFTERYAGGGRRIVLRRRPVITVASVIEYDGLQAYPLIAEAGAGTQYDYRLDAARGVLTRRQFGYDGLFAGGDDDVAVIYTAGRPVMPGNIRMAALEELAHLWRNSQLARGGARATAAAEDIATAPMAYSLPNRVVQLLGKRRVAPWTA